jgi:putative membrane protein
MKTSALVGAVAALFATAALAQGAPKPTDPQIAHIAYTAGEIDIAAAKQALAKTKNPKVRAFAEEMVRDHTAVNQKALALVHKLHVTPQPNPTSTSLETDAKKTRAELAKLSGPAFDKAYIANEVTYHQTVDNALSGTLIPSAQNPELKSLLESGLKLFTEHLHHAEMLKQEIGA